MSPARHNWQYQIRLDVVSLSCPSIQKHSSCGGGHLGVLAPRRQVKSPHPTLPSGAHARKLSRCPCQARSPQRSPSTTCRVLATSKSPNVRLPKKSGGVCPHLSANCQRRTTLHTWDSPQEDYLGLAWPQLGTRRMAEASPRPTLPSFPTGLLPQLLQTAGLGDSSVPSSPHPRAHAIARAPQALPGRTGVTSLCRRPERWLALPPSRGSSLRGSLANDPPYFSSVALNCPTEQF